MKKDVLILRGLARDVRTIAEKPVQDERRRIWRAQNSFAFTRPPIYVRAFAFNEIFDEKNLECEDPFFRKYELYLRMMQFRDTIGDDFIIEPWLTVDAAYTPAAPMRWGVQAALGDKPQEGGAAAYHPEILRERDIEKLVVPHHCVDEAATKSRFEKLSDAVGDILDVELNRGSIFQMWSMDISTDLAKLRGLEQIMWDVYDRPEFLHRLLCFMRDGILRVHDEAERAGDLSLSNHENQAMPYARELQDPTAHTPGVRRGGLWAFMASQEYTTFSPDMFYEFILQYQIPIIEKFGLAAYGCCEDLTEKIGYLRKIPNLRRIAVSPFANARKCAEQIGGDYILSWRPNPATMISTGLDEDFVRAHMRAHFAIFRECGNPFDITLKDVETINRQPQNVAKWVRIVRQEIDRCF